MKKAYVYLLYLLIMIGNISGCEQKNPTLDSVTSVEEIIEEEADFDRTGLTWYNTQWMKPKVVDSTKRLYVDSYQTFQWVYHKGEKIADRRYGNSYYRLERVMKENDYDYVIEIYDIEKNIGKDIILNKAILLAEDVNGKIVNFHVKTENEIILLMEAIDDDKMKGRGTL